MEAPVPASALIHSATLVSAGVFLLLRFSPLFEISTYAFHVIPAVGSFTAFFGGICASYQSDIKRILAYSTISHCGFLMVSYSLFIPEYTILYLYIHGFFKAAVFLCAGNIIRFSRNYQDFKRMGFFSKYIPFEFFASFVCLINLCGLPFTLGFYIKHLLVLGLSTNNIMYYFFFANVVGGAVSGLFYSYKFFFYSFLDIKKAKKVIYDTSSNISLNSFFYSNTSLASNITITSLIIVSYIISLNLFNVFLNKNSIGSGLEIHSYYNTLSLEFVQPTISFLENISYFNWLILLLILALIFAT
jgi:NADH-quinone oxidoreductase subunit L